MPTIRIITNKINNTIIWITLKKSMIFHHKSTQMNMRRIIKCNNSTTKGNTTLMKLKVITISYTNQVILVID